ncbi:MAG: hypothetical protein IPM82_14810 [Saprospiraceae bacterium]|nr:hypothetical protein [Saprospiraceae bacterium]
MPRVLRQELDSRSTDTVLLNDGQHLTLEIVGYTFEGGAHGSPTAAVLTFEASTGKPLTWDDLVTDTTALKVVAEKKFKEVRQTFSTQQMIPSLLSLTIFSNSSSPIIMD